MRDGPTAPVDVLTREQCEALAKRVFGMIPAGAKARVSVQSGVDARTQFARGDSHLAAETAGVHVVVDVSINGRRGEAAGTQVDDEGLRRLVSEAEAASRQWRGEPRDLGLLEPQQYRTPPKLFFDEVLPLMTPDGRASIMRAALDATEAAGLIGAGDIHFSRSSRALLNTAGLFAYYSSTSSSFSLTARTRDGSGSGWAWDGHRNWSRVDPRAVIARAVELGQRSANPVAVEPGRYTVILEPAAVAALISSIEWDAQPADFGYTVFSKEPRGTNKIGLKMMDERLNMVSDPWDPESPQSTVRSNGEPVDAVQWFQDGTLRNLSYNHWYAEQKHRDPVVGPENLRLFGRGPTQTLEEMIAGTRRGIWVNRLSHLGVMNRRTLLLTGTTRDGTFLIENGRITKPIKNFRFTESPFFVFNKLEAFGEPVRALGSAVAPRIKVRDFNFTSLTEAI